jgi:hypothetical protein
MEKTDREIKIEAFLEMLTYTDIKDYKDTLEEIIGIVCSSEVFNIEYAGVLFELLEMFKKMDDKEREEPLQFIKKIGQEELFNKWLKERRSK